MERLIASIALSVVLTAWAHAQTEDFSELVKTGAPQEVQGAIDKGAEVNARTTELSTPLINAAHYNPSAEVITLLLNAGADIKARSGGMDALDRVCRIQRQPRNCDHPSQGGSKSERPGRAG